MDTNTPFCLIPEITSSIFFGLILYLENRSSVVFPAWSVMREDIAPVRTVVLPPASIPMILSCCVLVLKEIRASGGVTSYIVSWFSFVGLAHSRARDKTTCIGE